MNLHVDCCGNNGAPLLFIHGWGMHSGMWGGVLSQLAAQYRVMAVDLPGHGFSAENGKWKVVSSERDATLDTHHLPLATYHSPLSVAVAALEAGTARPTPCGHATHYLDSIVDQLAAQFTGPLAVCGWSLGGQIASRWAQRHPEQVQRLILVSSTPCFVQRDDWPCAMAAQTLTAFAASLQKDYAATLRRFLALQVRGSEQERELLANLRNMLQSRPAAELTALQSGLEMLRDVDLRAVLPAISRPALLIAGVRDTLTPLAASQYLATHLPAARLAAIEGAAHAPFLSHPDVFIELVRNFLHE